MTVETYGVIANLILLESLSKINTKKKGSPRIKIITDNKEVIKGCNNPPEIINANQTMVLEYDLWRLIWDLIPKIKATLVFQWQPGHQDELKTGEKIHGPFKRPSQINIENDRAAGKNDTTFQPTPRPL